MLCLSVPANAAQIKKARPSPKVSKKISQSVGGARGSAGLHAIVGDNTTLRTDRQLRTDLRFANRSIARLWAQTILNVKDSGRSLFLQEGALFIDVPTSAELTTVRGASVAVELSGASALFEYHEKVFKVLVLKGTARIYRPDHVGDSVLVDAGQLVFGNPNAALSDPVDFDIKHFLKTSRFLSDFPPLRSQGLSESEIQKQEIEKSKKVLIETNLVMYGGGTAVSATGRDSATPSTTRGSGP
jgi:hypothetical protein